MVSVIKIVWDVGLLLWGHMNNALYETENIVSKEEVMKLSKAIKEWAKD